jgi:DNA repair protein RecO (recombination protein O)
MPVHSSDALVLRTYRYGEADCIVVFLTADRGKKRGVAKNAIKSRRRFGAALEPLTRGKATYVEHEHRELVRLERIEPATSPMRLSPGLQLEGSGRSTAAVPDSGLDASALSHAAYFAELLSEWAPDGHANERLFRLGTSVAEALGGRSIDALARYFEYWLLRLEGVYPAADLGTRLSPQAIAFLKSAAVRTPAEIAAVDVAAKALREIESVHHQLIALHLEKELRSARVVRELRPHS